MKTLSVKIRQKSFKRRLLGGLPSQEVESYLKTLSTEFDKLTDENHELSSKLKKTSQELDKMRQMEESLIKALDHAQHTSDVTIHQAKKEADILVREGRLKSANIIQSAEADAQKLLDSAKQEHNDRVIKYKSEIKNLKKDYQVIDKHTDVMIEELNRIMRETSVTINRLTELKKITQFESNIDDSTSAKMYINRHITPEAEKEAKKYDDSKKQAFISESRPRPTTKKDVVSNVPSQNKAKTSQKDRQPQTILDKLQSTKGSKNAQVEEPKNLHEKILFENFLNQAHSA